MKQIFIALVFGLMIGCTSTKPINGKYDADLEYKARGTAESIETSGGTLPMPKEEFIASYLEDLQKRNYDAEIEFPELKVTINYPDKPTKTVLFHLKEVDETHYIARSITGSNPQDVEFVYDPVEETFSSKITKYIKR